MNPHVSKSISDDKMIFCGLWTFCILIIYKYISLLLYFADVNEF